MHGDIEKNLGVETKIENNSRSKAGSERTNQNVEKRKMVVELSGDGTVQSKGRSQIKTAAKKTGKTDRGKRKTFVGIDGRHLFAEQTEEINF